MTRSGAVRTLEPTPRTFLDPATGGPAFGSYSGPLPPVDLGRSTMIGRLTRRKKWVYVAIASNDLWISLAVVRMGYVTSAFAFVYDVRRQTMLADETVVGPPRAAEIADDPHAAGVVARFGFGRASVAFERGPGAAEIFELRARIGKLAIDAEIDASNAPRAIAAIASLGPGLVSATEKRALARVRGHVVAGRHRHSIDGALGGYDYTQGLLPRRTRWRWAFAMGQTTAGAPIAFNVVSGFVGEAECAIFHEGAVYPIGEARFDFDLARPERRWRLTSEEMTLAFDPGAVHTQDTNLVVVRSRFLQPVGAFSGGVRAHGEDVRVDRLSGVVENQDVVW